MEKKSPARACCVQGQSEVGLDIHRPGAPVEEGEDVPILTLRSQPPTVDSVENRRGKFARLPCLRPCASAILFT